MPSPNAKSTENHAAAAKNFTQKFISGRTRFEPVGVGSQVILGKSLSKTIGQIVRGQSYCLLGLLCLMGCASEPLLVNNRPTLDDMTAEFVDILVDKADHSSQVGHSKLIDLASPPSVAPVDLQSLRAMDNAVLQPMSRDDVIQIALQNSTFIRTRGDFLSPSNTLLANPLQSPSAYDVLMQTSGRQSVEAALADFDLQLASGIQWGHNSLIQGNNSSVNPLLNNNILVNDSGTFYGRVDKSIRSGANLSLIHLLNYANQTPTSSVSGFHGVIRGELRQPLLSGRGRAFTDIAGPQSYRNRSLGRGVAVAEIEERLSLIDFQIRLQSLWKQTDELYWELWLAYRVEESQRVALTAAERILARIKTRAASGLDGSGLADQAQAEEYFYQRKDVTDSALIELRQSEGRLRRHLGLGTSGDQFIQPKDVPEISPIIHEWKSVLQSAVENRPELHKQDLRIRNVELMLLAAKSLTKTQLDLVSGVQFNGVGDEIIGSNTNGPPSTYGSIIGGDDTGWNVGIEMSMPAGFRKQRATVRELTLLLSKARAARSLQETEIAHELSNALAQMERWFASIESAEMRRDAASRRQAAVEADFNAGRTSLDQLLRAQESFAEAEIQISRAKTEYLKARTELSLRNGNLIQPEFLRELIDATAQSNVE